MRFRTKHWVALIGVAIAIGVAGVLVLANRVDDEGTEDDAATTSPSPSASSPFDPADRRETAWGTELIFIEVPMTSGKGHRIQAYFVSGGSNATLLANARECVLSYLEDFQAASCYAFDTEEALAYANVAETGEMEYLCWRAYVSGARGVEGAEAMEDGQYAKEGCPEASPS